MNPDSDAGTVTFLFTDIEGSTRLWEQEPERMRLALARHDELTRAAVVSRRGTVVKMTGDGVYAAFDDAVDAVMAALQLQQALADANATHGIALRIRCGVHAGVVERRDNDFFGSAVNRTARIMSAAHSGQVLLSQGAATLVEGRLEEGVALRDLGAVRLRDLANPERVYQLLHPQLRPDFPALRSLETTPNNLPQQVTSFVGRETELTKVRQLLADSRLLTLLGMGGLGKTRLSLQVAADMLEDFPDGVWFVELAPLADARLVPLVVASVLGVKEEPGHPVQEALVRYVKDRRLLLVLDNCEHLIAACADLVKHLLQSGPLVKILASSREPLHVRGETSFPLLPLAVPDPYLTFKRQTLEQYAAARLFVERATAAQPAFRISDENAMAIASICQRLDGIPLALELAAARVRALSVEKIEARLCDRFRLLTGGDRTALPRQQTLRALIDWSYDLLAETERALLRRLAVFAGGWTLEGAEAVGAGGDLDAIDVLDLLTNLVEKSLVVLDAEGERYRLLETVREYALERLDGSGDGDGARTRHLEFHVALAEEADPKLRGVEQGAWASRLDLELENLLAAHTWCDRLEGGAEPGLRLAYAVRLYWLNRGLVELGYRVTTEALARSGAQVAGPHRCRALFAAGQQAFFMGRYRDAEAHLTASVAMARQIGDKGRIAAGLQLLGMAAHGQGDVAIARAHLTESLAIARESGDRERLPFSLSSLAELHRAEGDLDAAEPLYEEALVLDRERGDQADCAVNLLNLTMVAIGRGRWERARATLQEALGIVVAIRSRQGGQAVLDVSAGFAAACEDWERCARLYGAAQTQLTRTSLHRDPADKAFLEPLIAAARAALGQAAFGALEAAGGELDYEAAMAEARAWLTAGLSVSA